MRMFISIVLNLLLIRSVYIIGKMDGKIELAKEIQEEKENKKKENTEHVI